MTLILRPNRLKIVPVVFSQCIDGYIGYIVEVHSSYRSCDIAMVGRKGRGQGSRPRAEAKKGSSRRVEVD